MTNKKTLEENIIPHLKFLKKRAEDLVNQANNWEISPNYKQGFPKYDIINILVEVLLGEAAFAKINELVKNLPAGLGIKYLFQYELNFLRTRLGLIQAGIEVNLEEGNTTFWDEIHQYSEDWEDCLIILEHLSFLFFGKKRKVSLRDDIISKLKYIEEEAKKTKSEIKKWELSVDYKEAKRTRYRPFYRIINLIVRHDIFYNFKNLFEENKQQLANRFEKQFSRIADECSSIRKSIEKDENGLYNLKNIQECAEDWEDCLIILEHFSSLLFNKKATM